MDFLRYLEGIRNGFGNAFFSIATYGGEEITVLLIICLCYWCLNKRLGYRFSFSFFVSGLIVHSLKVTFRVPRPWVFDPNFHAVESALKTATGYAFPSGHSQTAAVLFGTLALAAIPALAVKTAPAASGSSLPDKDKSCPVKRNALRFILCLLAILLVMLSRCYLGVHYPSDVFCGCLIGLVCVGLVHFLAVRFKFTAKSELIIMLLVFALSILATAYVFTLYLNGTVDYQYASDTGKIAGSSIGFGLCWFLENRYINFNTKGGLKTQLLKLLIGIAGVCAIKFGLKLVIGTSLAADISRYFLLIVWAMLAMPLIIRKWFAKN